MKGIWREGSLAGDPEGYVEKALETVVSFHRGLPWGNWWRGRLLETLIELLSMKRFRGGGLGEGGELLNWGPWKIY